MNAIRTTITKTEFGKLTWKQLDTFTDDINDINISLVDANTVLIDVLGYEIKRMNIEAYNETLKG